MIKPANLLHLPLLLLFTGCSTLSTLNSRLNPWSRENQVDSISVYVAPNPELQHAVNIDVVFCYTETVQTMLSEIDAIQWFTQKQGVIAGYGNQLDVLEWQMVRGFGEQIQTLPENHKAAIEVIAFAYSYDNPNAKAVITELSAPWIIFKDNQLMTLNKPKETILSIDFLNNK